MSPEFDNVLRGGRISRQALNLPGKVDTHTHWVFNYTPTWKSLIHDMKQSTGHARNLRLRNKVPCLQSDTLLYRVTKKALSYDKLLTDDEI